VERITAKWYRRNGEWIKRSESTKRQTVPGPLRSTHLFEKSYQEELEAKTKKQVECLGMTFENDEARRAYFLEKLKEKLKDPDFRKIEGFTFCCEYFKIFQKIHASFFRKGLKKWQNISPGTLSNR